MSVDINKIAQDKISKMEENGEIKEYIEERLEKLILQSVDNSLNGWELKKKMEKKIESQISPCLDTLDFTAYNSFICEKVKQITNEVLKEDIAKKISCVFENMFILKREKIKLSEIFEAYREFLIEDLEDNEKYELGNEFYYSISGNDRGFTEYSFSQEKPTTSSYSVNRKDIYNCDFGFVICEDYNKKGIGKIITVYFEGLTTSDVLKIKSYNTVQTLLLNLQYNETPIELDIDENYIQSDLGLDI